MPGNSYNGHVVHSKVDAAVRQITRILAHHLNVRPSHIYLTTSRSHDPLAADIQLTSTTPGLVHHFHRRRRPDGH
eukprot:4108372-Amphidinium_carterae.1